MRIAIMGAGSVGGYFGGLLAKAGNEVTLLARGAHLEAIRRQGLVVKSNWGEFNAQVSATNRPQEVGPVDLVMLTVKTYQNPDVIPGLLAMMDQDTSVLTLQNGVESYVEVAKQVGHEGVLAGAAYIETHIESPGVIKQVGEVVRIVFGETDGRSTPRAERVLEAFKVAEIVTEMSPDVVKTLWTKFLFISTLAGLTSVARAPMSDLLTNQASCAMVLATMQEIEAVGRASGVALDPDVVDRTMDYMRTAAKDLHASMHTDLELGRPLELEALNGAVVRMGVQVGVPTPINNFIYATLVVHIDGAKAGGP